MAADLPYRDLNSYLKGRFGERVQKITLDAGLTCPNRDGRVGAGGCLYCNARGSGTGAWGRGQSIPAQMEAGIARLSRRYGAARFIAYFQSFSNTYAPLARLRELYEAALASPQVVGLSIGTRPDCLGDDVLDLLAGYARDRLVWLELGLQSAHDATLARLNRGHDAACFSEAAARAAARGLAVVAHVILGLPGEGPREMAATARYLARLPVHGVKIHLLYVDQGFRTGPAPRGWGVRLPHRRPVRQWRGGLHRTAPAPPGDSPLDQRPPCRRAGGPGLVSG